MRARQGPSVRVVGICTVCLSCSALTALQEQLTIYKENWDILSPRNIQSLPAPDRSKEDECKCDFPWDYILLQKTEARFLTAF